jgi:DNA sulfur modification protein DndD
MEAFGSFADRQEIDFEALGGRRLFLIHGPTGAGKSTILEAICFALYGSPTGGSDVAAATHLRSHHAEPDRLARVALDFALGEKRYRVGRHFCALSLVRVSTIQASRSRRSRAMWIRLCEICSASIARSSAR